MAGKKKKGSKRISSESRTALIAAAAFLVIGLFCVIYGKVYYRNDKMVLLDDVRTGVTATVVSVDKRERNLSPSDKALEEKKGYTEEEIRWEYLVTYSVEDGGEEYTYDEVERFRSDGKYKPEVGDTDVINYAIIDGEFVPHPETPGTNGVVISGYFLLVLSLISFGVGMYIRK